MDKKYLKKLAEQTEQIEKNDPQNDVLWKNNYNEKLKKLSVNLDDTIDYLNTCSEMELFAYSEIFGELYELFKSNSLIDCYIYNSKRFDNPELQECITNEISFIKKDL